MIEINFFIFLQCRFPFLRVAYSFEIKAGLSFSKKNCVICLIENPLKSMKNAFYLILVSFFVLKTFQFLPRIFVHVGKTAREER